MWLEDEGSEQWGGSRGKWLGEHETGIIVDCWEKRGRDQGGEGSEKTV